jgi:hypothetical protein
MEIKHLGTELCYVIHESAARAVRYDTRMAADLFRLSEEASGLSSAEDAYVFLRDRVRPVSQDAAGTASGVVGLYASQLAYDPSAHLWAERWAAFY